MTQYNETQYNEFLDHEFLERLEETKTLASDDKLWVEDNRKIPIHVLSYLKDNIPDDVWVAGGACISILKVGHQFGDIDIFVNNRKNIKVVADIVRNYNSDVKESTLLDTEDVIVKNYTDDCGGASFQIIYNRHITSLKHLLAGFDLANCAIGFDNQKLIKFAGTDWAIENNKIIFNVGFSTLNIKTPNQLSKLISRIFKYVKKGFEIEQSSINSLIVYFCNNLPTTTTKPSCGCRPGTLFTTLFTTNNSNHDKHHNTVW